MVWLVCCLLIIYIFNYKNFVPYENSILSIEQHNGFKNYINTTSPYYLYQSQSDGLTYTMQSDGTMTISGSKTSSSWADIYIGYVTANITYQAPPVIPANDYVIICDGIPNNANITLWGKIGGAAETQLGTAATGASPRSTFTVSADTIITKWKISITSSTTVNFVFKPLLVDQVTADMGFTDYQPYALSNITVTPGLIECVDAGAKNVLQNVATSKTENNVTFTVNTDGSVKVQTTAAGASAGTNLSLTGSYISNKYGGYVISGIPAGTLDSVYLYVAYSNNGTSESTHKEVRKGNTLIIDGSYSHIQVIVRVQSGAIATTALTLYPMVCTKAAFSVSQKFVPYRPDYDTTLNNISVIRRRQIGFATLGEQTRSFIVKRTKGTSTLRFPIQITYSPQQPTSPPITLYLTISLSGATNNTPTISDTCLYLATGLVSNNVPLPKIYKKVDTTKQWCYFTIDFGVDSLWGHGAIAVGTVEDEYIIDVDSNIDVSSDTDVVKLIMYTPDVFNMGTEILGTASVHEDLNNYTALGTYYCLNSTNTGYVDHCPVTGSGFKLIVENVNAAKIFKQTITKPTDASRFWVRTFSNNAWSSWYVFTGTVVS